MAAQSAFRATTNAPPAPQPRRQLDPLSPFLQYLTGVNVMEEWAVQPHQQPPPQHPALPGPAEHRFGAIGDGRPNRRVAPPEPALEPFGPGAGFVPVPGPGEPNEAWLAMVARPPPVPRPPCCCFCYGTACRRARDLHLPIPHKDEDGPWRHKSMRNGVAVCPALRQVRCDICGATGDFAHTTRFHLDTWGPAPGN